MSRHTRWRDLRTLLVLATVTVGSPYACTCDGDGSPTGPDPEETEDPVCVIAPASTVDFGAVPVGEGTEVTLQVSNGNVAEASENQFAYEFLLPGSDEDCGDFSFPSGGRTGIVGPGATVGVPVRFQPSVSKAYACEPSILALRVSGGVATNTQISNPCPSPLTWVGAGAPKWEECMLGEEWSDLYGIYSGGETLMAVGDAGTVLQNIGGCLWVKLNTSPVYSLNLNLRDVWVMDAPGEHVLWAVGNRPPPAGQYGDRGAIIRYDLTEWTQPNEGWLVTYGSVWGSDSDDVWFVGQGVSTDFPNTWHWTGIGLDSLIIDMGMSQLTGVHGTASDDVWAVLNQSFFSIYHFDGDTWEDRTQPFMNQPLHDVWASTNGHVYAVGGSGAIYHFDGTTWADESIPGETRAFNGVWVDAETGWAVVVGNAGAIYHFDGTQWTEQTLDHVEVELEDLHDVFGHLDDTGIEVWAVGSGDTGVILRLTFEP